MREREPLARQWILDGPVRARRCRPSRGGDRAWQGGTSSSRADPIARDGGGSEAPAIDYTCQMVGQQHGCRLGRPGVDRHVQHSRNQSLKLGLDHCSESLFREAPNDDLSITSIPSPGPLGG